MSSRLHTICVTGGDEGERVLGDSLAVVLALCANDEGMRRKLHVAIGAPYRAGVDYDSPAILSTNASALYTKSSNSFYHLFIVLCFMDFDPSLFGAFMLHGETELKKNQFMTLLKEALDKYISGKKTDGSIFSKEDSILQRKAGPFVCWIIDNFVTL